MTIIDEYFSTCNDCSNRWTSYVGVSTNTFGMTSAEAESHLKYFAGLEVDSPFYCYRCGSFDISYSTPSGYGSQEGRTGPRDVVDALIPAIRKAMYQCEQSTDIEVEAREKELSRLSTYECLTMASAEKLAQTSNEEKRKAVLDELAKMVREWDVNATSDAAFFDVPAFLRRRAD